MKLFKIGDHGTYNCYAIVMAESEDEAKQKLVEELGKQDYPLEDELKFYDLNQIEEITSGVELAERS